MLYVRGGAGWEDKSSPGKFTPKAETLSEVAEREMKKINLKG